MTNQERRDYSEQHQRKVKSFERKYLKQVFTAVHSQILSFTKTAREKGLDDARRELDKTVTNEHISPVILSLYADAGTYQANKVNRQINQSIRSKVSHKQLVLVYRPGVSTPGTFETKAGFGNNPQWVAEIINYLKKHLLEDVVVPVTETTKKQILAILQQGQDEGWGIDKIVSKLDSDELTLWRARLIVRTELAKAYFAGQKAAIRQSKFETYDEWISAHDDRTRHSHLLVDGTTVDTGQRFMVKTFTTKGGVEIETGFDLMEGPGDPRASIGNIANCRCTKVTRAKRDDNGRLISKSQYVSVS